MPMAEVMTIFIGASIVEMCWYLYAQIYRKESSSIRRGRTTITRKDLEDFLRVSFVEKLFTLVPRYPSTVLRQYPAWLG